MTDSPKARIALVRIEQIELAEREMAYCKGAQARAYNRPRGGALVPKAIAADAGLLDSFQAGWDKVDVAIAAAELGEAE